MSVPKPIVAILATINTKSEEVHFIANVLKRAGATPWIVDLSMKPHNLPLADITGEQVARLADRSWLALEGYVRQEAAGKRQAVRLALSSRTCSNATNE